MSTTPFKIIVYENGQMHLIHAGQTVDLSQGVGLTDSQMPTDVTLKGNKFNIANGLIEADSDGNYPALNGESIQSLNANNINSGTLSSSHGGAGVNNGILKADGSGNVTSAIPDVDFQSPINIESTLPLSSYISNNTINIAIQEVSTSQDGYLSHIDYSNFINNELPSQTGNAGKILTTNGTSTYWGSSGGGDAGSVASFVWFIN